MDKEADWYRSSRVTFVLDMFKPDSSRSETMELGYGCLLAKATTHEPILRFSLVL